MSCEIRRGSSSDPRRSQNAVPQEGHRPVRMSSVCSPESGSILVIRLVQSYEKG